MQYTHTTVLCKDTEARLCFLGLKSLLLASWVEGQA